jgi:hydrogenase maturation protein HypF
MFGSLAAVRQACAPSFDEVALLESPQRPIVLVRRRGDRLAAGVAPRNPLVGAMLAYTPLHHLLLSGLDRPVVATSGNVSDEPIVIDECEALARLANIADLFLVHDRPIARPLDDSVARIVAGRPQIIRRARGHAPAPAVDATVPPGILALGGHLKTTIALSSDAGVVLGQHIGDLATGEARDVHARCCRDLATLHAVTPRVIVRDLHPDYHTSVVGDAAGLPVVAVQHHLAHVAACMAEHRLEPPVLGVAFDGTGYGTDGTIWGGEFLSVTGDGWQRVAYLRPFRLPGGEAAVREPRRSAFGLLVAAYGDRALAMTALPPVAGFSPAERATLLAMIERRLNAPLTTSVGRLFDAVAAIVGLRQRTSYEGQAAAELEWALADEECDEGYRFALCDSRGNGSWVVAWEAALAELLADLHAGVGIGCISARFHAGLAQAIAQVAARAGIGRVLLTGGCFQNARLTEQAVRAVRAANLKPYWHQHVPPNDGGLALGQAMWAARSMTTGVA